MNDKIESVINIEVIIRNMIVWAEEHLGDTGYAGWCLSFCEDALELSNGIEIYGGDSARASCDMYRDALQTGKPEKGAFVFYDCLCRDEDGSEADWGHCGICIGDGQVIHAWNIVRIDAYMDIETLPTADGHPTYIGWVPVSRVLAQPAD